MKKSAAGAALVAAVGFSALTAAPASALSYPLFENCDAAAAAGVYNTPAGDPRYTPALDSDADGIGCENPDYAYVPLPRVGGADTGVAVAPEKSTTGITALGLAGLAAAVTSGVVIARRRTARA